MKNFISSMAAMNAVMNELGLDGQELYGLSIVRAVADSIRTIQSGIVDENNAA